MSIKWEREQIEKFIVCMQQNPCLYNVKSAEYMDRALKAKAYNNILLEMQEFMGNITLEELKRKWKNLRTQYTQELRTQKQSKKSGSGRGDVYVPKLWCFLQLSFLNTHVQIRESADNTKVVYKFEKTCEPGPSSMQSDIENTSASYVEESTSSSFCHESSFSENPPKKRSKNFREINGFRNDLDCFKSLLAQKKKRKFDWLGNLVATQMEYIDPDEQADAAWQVQCLIRELTSKSDRKRKASTSSPTSARDILELVFDEEYLD